MITGKIKIAGCTFDVEFEGLTLQAITDEALNGEGCNVTRNSIIVTDADVQLRGSALMFKASNGAGPLQQINYPSGDDVPTEDLSYTLDSNNGGAIAAA